MTNAINSLVRSVFQKQSVADCSEAELRELCNRFPYFSASHLLLTQKLKETNSPFFTEQLNKTGLYFQDPLWTEALLEKKGTISIDYKVKETAADPAPLVEEPAIETAELPVAALQQAVIEEKEKTMVSAPATVNIEEEMAEVETNETEPEQLVSMPALKIEPIDPATAELSFEPYHTVDYFASQGIKIREEDKTRDKFGKQLMSFTEWLKTIKKMPVTEIAGSQKPDKQVDQMAEHSLVEKEVATEAMAEVWAKQGNAKKAIEIYQKLSLQNPSKSSYFASLIEQLKKS